MSTIRRFSNIYVIAAVLVASTAVSGATWYVKVTPTGLADCSSWDNACDLQTAMSLAADGDVWVQAGTYDLTSSLWLKDDVRVIGGFAGTETVASEGDPYLNVTILRGGGGQDPSECGTMELPIVYSKGNSFRAILRGFVLEDGDSEGWEFGTRCGGGAMLIIDGFPRIGECTFRNNFGRVGGAVGIYNAQRRPLFTHCKFYGNGKKPRVGAPDEDELAFAGGAVGLWETAATFHHCLFYDNHAQEGGAIWVSQGTESTLILRNCTVAGNVSASGFGGGISISNTPGFFVNSIVRDNIGSASLPGLADIGSSNDNVRARFSNLPGVWPLVDSNIDVDAMFVNAVNGDYRLRSGSPSVDTALGGIVGLDVIDLDYDSRTIEHVPFDLKRERTRVGSEVDMGPFEVNCIRFSSDCNANGKKDACELLDGDEPDCNENAVIDTCDITNGTSQDCNTNGIPDGCEASSPNPPCCADSDCISGSLCCDNICVATACCDDATCGAGAVCCVDTCFAGDCCGDLDCAAGSLCCGNTCTAGSCCATDDCDQGAGEVCCGNACTAIIECCADSDCGLFGTCCNDNTCVSGGGACCTDNDCGAGAPFCCGNSCSATCCDDSQCGKFEICCLRACELPANCLSQ